MAEPDPMVQLEAAIMARLGATASSTSVDPELAALLPGGLHSRQAGGETYPYLNLTLVRMDSDYTFTTPYRHRFLYNIVITDEGAAIDASSAALMRVYTLLQDAGVAELPMEDFTIGYARRRGRVGTSPVSVGSVYQRVVDEWRFEVYPV